MKKKMSSNNLIFGNVTSEGPVFVVFGFYLFAGLRRTGDGRRQVSFETGKMLSSVSHLQVRHTFSNLYAIQ